MKPPCFTLASKGHGMQESVLGSETSDFIFFVETCTVFLACCQRCVFCLGSPADRLSNKLSDGTLPPCVTLLRFAPALEQLTENLASRHRGSGTAGTLCDGRSIRASLPRRRRSSQRSRGRGGMRRGGVWWWSGGSALSAKGPIPGPSHMPFRHDALSAWRGCRREENALGAFKRWV